MERQCTNERFRSSLSQVNEHRTDRNYVRNYVQMSVQVEQIDVAREISVHRARCRMACREILACLIPRPYPTADGRGAIVDGLHSWGRNGAKLVVVGAKLPQNGAK